MTEETWIAVAPKSAVPEGEMLGVSAGGHQIALYNLDGEIYATDNICSHAFALLTDGYFDGDTVECPLHAGRFEIKTGKGMGPPIPCDIASFPVRVVGDDIQVQVTPKT